MAAQGSGGPEWCLTLRPTREEFSVPFATYVRRVFRKHPDLPMFKVVPPEGWAPRAKPFPKLEQVAIATPIKQHVFGTRGAYRCLLVEQKAATAATLRDLAEQEDHQPPRHGKALLAGRDAAAAAAAAAGGAAAAAGGASAGGGAAAAAGAAAGGRRRAPSPAGGTGPHSDDADHANNSVGGDPSGAAPAGGISTRRQAGKQQQQEWARRAADAAAASGDELMERAFWSSVTITPPFYGADTPQSFFDDKVPYGWNLRRLDGCLLKRPGVPHVPGVTTPMTYFGMWKAFFAWHVEDADLMSINYLHFGAPKVWYCVSPRDRGRFERMAQSLFPELHRGCPAFMRHKDILLSPALLRTYGVRYVQAKQEANEFIVLNAAAYHSGYNTGFNCAEAVNFATPEWVELGRHVKRCKCSALRDGVRLSMRLFGVDESGSDSEESEEEEASVEEEEEREQEEVRGGGKGRRRRSEEEGEEEEEEEEDPAGRRRGGKQLAGKKRQQQQQQQQQQGKQQDGGGGAKRAKASAAAAGAPPKKSHHKQAPAAPTHPTTTTTNNTSNPMAGAANGAGRAFRAGGGPAVGGGDGGDGGVARRGVSGVSGGVHGGFDGAEAGRAAARACFAVVGQDDDAQGGKGQGGAAARFFHLVRIEGLPGPGHPPGSVRVRWLKEDLRDGLFRPDLKKTTWVERRSALVPVRAAWVDAPPGKASGGGLRLLTLRSRLLAAAPVAAATA
jgi:[histone H3]-trimethyl-L-lysine9/36 demethylase